jgi:hypothetical protein
MTGGIVDYAVNWRDGEEYECHVVKRWWRLRKVYWYEGPDMGHEEWLNRKLVKEYCLRKPPSLRNVVQ